MHTVKEIGLILFQSSKALKLYTITYGCFILF